MPTLDLPPDQSDGATIFASLINRIRTAIIAVNSAVDTATSNISALTTTVSGKAAASHTHAASDVTSGLIATARLGSGTASSSTYLTGAQTYATPVAANGIPAGGTTGQTLQKTSGTDYATGWATVTSSGTVSDASTTTKGIVILAGDLSGTASSPTVPGLAAKAPIASPTFTGTVSGISKSMVGLGSVDNTADTAKPVSSAQQSALDLKAPLTRALPSGGTTGQVLAKTSSTDYATGWTTPTSTGSVADASTTTKGIVQLTGDLAGTASSPTVPGLANKAALSHTHSISDVSDLQTQLNQKAPLARGLPAGGSTGQALVKTSSSDYATGFASVAVVNRYASGAYPTRPTADVVIWRGTVDPGSSALDGDQWIDVA